jgi:hypothetical protein
MSVLALPAEQRTLAQVGRKEIEPTLAPGAIHLERQICIRSYRPLDRAAVRHLCCETGFLGNPVDHLFQDRELFADLFTKAYLEKEPDWALIVEAQGQITGYLLGSVRTDFDRALMVSGLQTVLKMLCRLAFGRYAQHPRSRQFIRWLLTAGFREQPKHPVGAAHLHWNLARSFRGRGVARRLWEVYERRLHAAGVKQCYGAFFSYAKRQPLAVYARYGFHEFDRCPTTLFAPEIPGRVDVVCVCKDL